MLIDKPYKWTSFDAIHQIKVLLKLKIGHCGTLDPLATGLLICCTGEKTKEIALYQGLPKVYTGIICLGATTPTYDLESLPENEKPFSHLSAEDIHRASLLFIGDIMQMPPAHSAIKKDGKRAYDLARSGKTVELQARPITIETFAITQISLPDVHFKVVCSTGTYIRSLAHDFGAELGCGGYLKELRRTQIGNYKVENALTPLQYKEIWKPSNLQPTSQQTKV